MSIAAIVFLTVTASTFVEYQWKVSAAEKMHGNEEGLARYFGYFYSVVYLITGALQLFVTKRVLLKRGVIFGMLAFPAALLATTVISWLVSAVSLRLWPLTLSKGCDTLKRSLNDPSMKVLYGPLPQRMRRQAIAFVAGVCKPIAEAGAALVLLFIAHAISLRHLSLIVAGLLVVCLILIVRVWVWFAVGKEPVAAKVSPVEGQ
jgi:ATP/ADP translocase